MNGNKLKKYLTVSACAAGAVAASGYLVFDTVMNRSSVVTDKAFEFFKKFGKVTDLPEPEEKDERLAWFENERLYQYNLKSDRGLNLRAYLLKTDEPSNVYVFCSHGYRSSGIGEFGIMAKFYHDLGINVFMVDHQAAGESEGKYAGFGYHESVDSRKWINFMIDEFGKDIQIFLHGVSMGSATVMMMSGFADLPSNVKFTVADCGYTSAMDEFLYNIKQYHVPAHPVIDSANFFNRKCNDYDFRDASPIDSVKHAQVPILFIHGKADDFVPTYMGKELFMACNAPYKDLVLVDGAVHARSYITDSALYEASVKGFIDKYIEF